MTDIVIVALITSIPSTIAALGSILNHFGIQAVAKNTDGINNRLQRQVDTQATEAQHVAELTDKDKTIAALSKKVNGED